LREKTVFPDPGRPYAHNSGKIEGSSGHVVTAALGRGKGLSRDHGLVHRRGPLRHGPVGGNALPGLYEDHHVLLYSFDGDHNLPPVRFKNPGLPGLHREKCPNLLGGLVPKMGFYIPARKVESHDHGSHRTEGGHGKSGIGEGARAPRSSGARHHQNVHIGVKMGEGDPRPLQGIPSRPEEYPCTSEKFQGVIEGNVQPCHVKHHQGHKRDRHQPRNGDVLFYSPVPGLFQIFGPFVRNSIAGVLHRRLQILPGDFPVRDDKSCLRCQVHRREHHAVNLLQ